MVIGLGKHDIILGRKWASHRGLLIDYKHRALIWPTSSPLSRHFNKVIIYSRVILFPKSPSRKDYRHQKDTDCRDALIKMESWRPILLRQGEIPDSIWAKDNEK